MSSPENPQFESPNADRLSEPIATGTFPPPSTAPPSATAQPSSPRPLSAENPVWSGWDVLVIAVLTAVVVFFAQLFIVLGAWHFVFPHASWLEVAQKPALALLSQLLTYIAVALYMILLVEGKYRSRFGQAIRWNWPGVAGLRFLGIGALMIGFVQLDRFLPMPKTTPFDQFFNRPLNAYLLTAFAVTFGPLMEELFFRGFLYPVLARRAGAAVAILVTSLLFGLMHAPEYGYSWAVLIIVLVGVVLTTIRALTKSVASSFLAHVGYNATLMLLAAWATDGFRHMEKAGLLLF